MRLPLHLDFNNHLQISSIEENIDVRDQNTKKVINTRPRFSDCSVSAKQSNMPDAKIIFHGSDQTQLVGTLSTTWTNSTGNTGPSNKNSYPAHCILLLHGGMGHRDYLYHKVLTRKILASMGSHVAVFRFDYNGNGDSHGHRFFLSSFWDDVADIWCAIRFLQQSPYRMRTVCVVGHSVGAQHVLQLPISCMLSSNGNNPDESGDKNFGSLDELPPLLVCVQPRFRLRYWYEEWERQCQQHGQWQMKWRSRGRPRSHIITKHDVTEYCKVRMDNVRHFNDPCFTGNIDVLTIHGLSRSNRNSAATVMGYGSDVETTIDGVVPVEDSVQVANRVGCDRHTLKIVRCISVFRRFCAPPSSHLNRVE
mgnify:CR=1 FL=1